MKYITVEEREEFDVALSQIVDEDFYVIDETEDVTIEKAKKGQCKFPEDISEFDTPYGKFVKKTEKRFGSVREVWVPEGTTAATTRFDGPIVDRAYELGILQNGELKDVLTDKVLKNVFDFCMSQHGNNKGYAILHAINILFRRYVTGDIPQKKEEPTEYFLSARKFTKDGDVWNSDDGEFKDIPDDLFIKQIKGINWARVNRAILASVERWCKNNSKKPEDSVDLFRFITNVLRKKYPTAAF